jgi:hypothetical protein
MRRLWNTNCEDNRVHLVTCQANWLKRLPNLDWRSNTSTKVFSRFSQYSHANAEILLHTGWTVYVERNIVAHSLNDSYHWSAIMRPLCIFELHVTDNNIKRFKCNNGNGRMGSPLQCCRSTKYSLLLSKIQLGLHTKRPIFSSDFFKNWGFSPGF